MRLSDEAIPLSLRNSRGGEQAFRPNRFPKLFVAADDFFERCLLVSRYVRGKLRGGPIPFRQPIGTKQFARSCTRTSKRGGRERDRRFDLFSRVPAAGKVETCRQQRGAVRGRTGVGVKLRGAPSPGCEEFAKN